MKTLSTWIVRAGEYLMSLSNSTRMTIVLMCLLLLGGGSVHKLYVNIRDLDKPRPPASPEEFIKPLEKIFHEGKTGMKDYQNYQRMHQHTTQELDSLSKHLQ